MGRIKDILVWKCPRCGNGSLYESKNPFNFGKITAMHRTCPNCDLRYEREQGFFIGAMYISYAINIALFIIATIIYFVLFSEKIDWRYYISSYVGLTVLLSPLIFRMARSIWISIYVKYEPEKRGEK